MELNETEVKSVAGSFIEELAGILYGEYSDNISGICIVFPNRRAGLFFKKYIAKKLGKPTWSPAIMSIRDFITMQAGFVDTDRLTLLFRLYEVFSRHTGGSESFDRFFPWGEMLLRDFDELDKYMADVRQLFHRLQDQKDIESRFAHLEPEQLEALRGFWESIDTSRLSREKKAFQDLWEILADVYMDFRAGLRKDNLCYDGMAARELAENPGRISTAYRQIIFAGFNSLNRCEEKIFGELTAKDQAKIYWDADRYYMDEGQEAGYYIRKYQSLFSNSFVIEQDSFSLGNKDITAIGVPLHMGQARVAGQLLDEKKGFWDMEKTAVVLPDERLLLPVLSSLPQGVDHVNITMGYPLRNTPLYTLFESIIELHSSRELYKGKFYHKPVRDIITHPYILYQDYRKNSGFIDELLKSNTIFLGPEDLHKEELPAVYKILFSTAGGAGEAIACFQELLVQIHRRFKEDEGDHLLEREYIYHFYVQLKRLGEIISEIPDKISLPTFWKLFRKLIESMNIPFSGEPLRGLQIMGTLETRGLDFENLFILSMNDGIMPQAPSSGSFVPFSLRKAFGLPTSEHHDRINAYYFYRLIQRAKNIFLLYNTETGDNGGGEKSRFLHQLIMESGLSVKERILENVVSVRSPDPVTVVKSPLIMEIMRSFLCDGEGETYRLTPSAVSAYLDCRLKFYFRYIAKLYEPEEIKEEVDAAVFGDILHTVMEALYRDLMAKKQHNQVEKPDFSSLRTLVQNDEFLLKAFRSHFKFPQFRIEGRNLLVKEVIKKLALRILELDEAYAPFEILGLETGGNLEEAFCYDFPFVSEGRALKIGLKGKLDRIDRKEGRTRIVDYKSGAASRNFSEISLLFSRDPARQNKTVNQALFYAMLFSENNPGRQFTVGIYSAREIFQPGFSSLLVQKRDKTPEEVATISQELLEEYKLSLESCFTELFDPGQPFTQTEEIKTCANCSYKGICGRE